MSVDAKLFVTCGKEKLFDVLSAVTAALNIWQRNLLDNHIATTEYMNRLHFLYNDNNDQGWTDGVHSDFSFPDIISTNFKVDDEDRSLKIFPDCSCDYSETYEGDKIIFSLGCWGMYNEIMMVVAKAVAPFGDVYYDFNDCDDQDFVKLENLND